MLTDRMWLRNPPLLLATDGTPQGILTLPLPNSFKVGMVVQLSSSTQPATTFQVKRMEGFIVSLGLQHTDIHDRADLSAFLIADGAALSSLEQNRPAIPPDNVLRFAYEEAPAIAFRNHLVDQHGNPFGSVANPLNVSGSFATTSAPKYEDLLPLLANANWLNLADYETVVPIFAGDLATLQYFQGGAMIARAFYRFVNGTNWDITLEHYINGDDGTILLDDDDSSLFVD